MQWSTLLYKFAEHIMKYDVEAHVRNKCAFSCLNPALPALMTSGVQNVMSTTNQLKIDFLYPVTVTSDLIESPEEKGACMASSIGKSVIINCLGLTGKLEHHVTLSIVINVNENNLSITINAVFMGSQSGPAFSGNETENTTSTENSAKFPLFGSTAIPTGLCVFLSYTLALTGFQQYLSCTLT